MVVGHGLLGRAFSAYADDDRFVIFASGVANSLATDPASFAREQRLLGDVASRLGHALLVYFSTLSVLGPGPASAYVDHKLAMEDEVRRLASYLIVRLPQVVGRSDNPATLVNFLVQRILSGSEFELWVDARRNLIDVEDVVKIVGHILEAGSIRSDTVAIASPFSLRAEDLVHVIEQILGKRAVARKIHAGYAPPIDIAGVLPLFAASGVRFPPDYVERVLRKYIAR
ncbi:MAG TPA: NAD-dependent epimerase/dehydratase family protein [Casimicrobiaceae bacterium]|jgi:nucleoside-diphosphate-sugar epimerase|nr:NAD-dependent epimerase/dehydratase family protein [Casimicrobiaceae bacterium]